MGYRDILSDHPYLKEIEFIQSCGIMTGDEKGNFNPGSTVTRAELCVIISNLFYFDYDSFRIDSSKVPEHIPSWVYPYFSACQYVDFLPENFEPELDNKATDADLYYIFDQAKKKYLPDEIDFKELKTLQSESPSSSLTREYCASLIYKFCKGVSIPVLKNLKNPKSLIKKILHIYILFSWIDNFYNPSFFDINLFQIYYTLRRLPRNNLDRIQLELGTMLEISQKRDEYFKYEGAESVYHYTTLSTMELLTKPNVNFRLSNSVYLNDPMEGFLAASILSKKLSQKKYQNLKPFFHSFHMSDSDASPYFIASFIKSADSLPMWVHYGARGSGCCLGLKVSNFCDDLYEVTYEKKHISNFFSDIINILSSYVSSFPEVDFEYDPVIWHARRILNQSRYLYKDSAYKYEEEVRMIRFVPLKAAKVEDIGELFPKIYWDTPLQKNRTDNIGLNFSAIILGPTVADPSKIAVALAQRGYDSSIVKKSKIKFR